MGDHGGDWPSGLPTRGQLVLYQTDSAYANLGETAYPQWEG